MDAKTGRSETASNGRLIAIATRLRRRGAQPTHHTHRLVKVAAPILAVGLGIGTATSASAAPPGGAGTGHGGERAPLTKTLTTDLNHYLAARRKIDHLSAVSLRVDFPGGKPSIDAAAGTTQYGGDVPVPPNAMWQIGSNTKAFTSVMMLQLEAAGKLSIHDTIGKWLPHYPAWRNITIKRLLDMTSGIPDYTEQPDFLRAVGSAPARTFSEAQLVGYVAHLPVGGAVYHYSNTNYILAQMIIERLTEDTYAHQLARRITIPLGLHSTCFAPYSCPPGTANRMPTPYNASGSGIPFLVNQPVPKLALTFGQAAGGIVASLRDLTTWNRALYTGKLLPPRQQHELESLVNVFTSKPVDVTSSTDPVAYGLGVIQATYSPIGLFWTYEGGTVGMRVWHVYDPRTGVVIALALNSSAASPDPADNGPDQDTVDELGFMVYRALEHYGAIQAA
jgi:D-alanyl-D-alanine carboxypeptidase